jgi:hypothetical protein
MRVKFQDQGDHAALARLAERLRPTPYASWPLEVESSRPLPGAPEQDQFSVRRRRLLLYDGDEIRALHNFFEHEIWIDGRPYPFVWPNGQLSEGIVDRRFAPCWLLVLEESLKRQPFHLVVGPPVHLQDILTRVSWSRAPALTRFLLPLRPAKVLREMSWFRRSVPRRLAANILAASGLGSALSYLVSGRKLRRAHSSAFQAQEWDHFGSWADDVWRQALPHYRAVTRRDAATLNRLYRPGDRRFRRFLVKHAGKPVGWFLTTTRILLTRQLDMGLGQLRPGGLIDAFAAPEFAQSLAHLAVKQLQAEDADIIFGHWSHRAWQRAVRAVGFLRAPARLPFFVSPAGRKLLFHADLPLEAAYFTIGDCDGPYFIEPESAPHPQLQQAPAA